LSSRRYAPAVRAVVAGTTHCPATNLTLVKWGGVPPTVDDFSGRMGDNSGNTQVAPRVVQLRVRRRGPGGATRQSTFPDTLEGTPMRTSSTPVFSSLSQSSAQGATQLGGAGRAAFHQGQYGQQGGGFAAPQAHPQS